MIACTLRHGLRCAKSRTALFNFQNRGRIASFRL
nr:MAG TPA: Halocidin family [Caudoviricetes sp.]